MAFETKSPAQPAVRSRKLDVFIATYDRPAKLHHLLRTGLDMGIPGAHFFVIDDCSTVEEVVSGHGVVSVERACSSFGSDKIIYVRNPENIGTAQSWERYYREFCDAEYTLTLTDKDEFIDGEPIASAIAKLDADPSLSMVVIPLRQRDREMDDRPLLFNYSRMRGREFVAQYIADDMLKHCSMMAVMRTDAIKKARLPHSLHLRDYGLADGFGMDLGIVLKMATVGDIEFESNPHIRRSTAFGATERYPLTFAYCYYQYANWVMDELKAGGFVTPELARQYLGFWLYLILRGLEVALRPVHGSELEPGSKRIRRHLTRPVHAYVPLECVRLRIIPDRKTIGVYFKTIRILLGIRIREWFENRRLAKQQDAG